MYMYMNYVLSVVLVFSTSIVYDHSDIGFVYTHSEGYGGHHTLEGDRKRKKGNARETGK